MDRLRLSFLTWRIRTWTCLVMLVCAGACHVNSALAAPDVVTALPLEKNERKVILRMERFASCNGCPAYELTFFDDGRHYYLGKDGVRRLGMAGSRFTRDILEEAVTKANARGIVVATLRDGNRGLEKAALAQPIKALQALKSEFRSLAVLALQESVATRSEASAWRTDIQFLLKDGTSEKVSFYDGKEVKSSLSRIARQIDLAHGADADLLPMPAIGNDGDVVLRWSVMWPDYVILECPGTRLEIVAYLHRDGTLPIYYLHRRAFLPAVEDPDTERPSLLLEKPIYLSTRLTVQAAQVARLQRLIASELPGVTQTFAERERPLRYKGRSVESLDLALTEFWIPDKGKLVSLHSLVRPGAAESELEAALDDVVVSVRQAVSRVVQVPVFRCDKAKSTY